MTIRDKVILITGASEGIGKATAELLHKRGAKIALAARSKDKLETVSGGLPGSLVVVSDMTDPGSITQMVETVVSHYGRIDVLINNAGRALRSPVERIDVEDYKQIMELNIYGPLRALQAVVPIMRSQGGGLILNISSNVSKMTLPSIGAYASTKYALNGLMLTARAELADDNIIVGVMHPGLTATGFGDNAIIDTSMKHMPTPGSASMKADSAEDVAKKILEAIEMEPAEQYMNPEIEAQFATA